MSLKQRVKPIPKIQVPEREAAPEILNASVVDTNAVAAHLGTQSRSFFVALFHIGAHFLSLTCHSPLAQQTLKAVIGGV